MNEAVVCGIAFLIGKDLGREEKILILFKTDEEVNLFSKALKIFSQSKVSVDPSDYQNGIFVSTVEKAYNEFVLTEKFLNLKVGMKIIPQKISEFLIQNGYTRVNIDPYTPGEFSVIGDIFEIKQKDRSKLRIEILFDEIEKIYLIDGEKIQKKDEISIPSLTNLRKEKLSEIFEEIICLCIWPLCQIHSKGQLKDSVLKRLDQKIFLTTDIIKDKNDIEDLISKNYNVSLFIKDWEEEYSMRKIFAGKNVKLIKTQERIPGFIIPNMKVAFINLRESEKFAKKKTESVKYPKISYDELENGVYVVHKVHGIGIFRGTSIEYGREFLKIEYRDSAMLYIPAEDIGLLHKYIGYENPPLDEIGGKTFMLRKARVRQSIEKHISDFLRAIAIRKSIKIEPLAGAEDILSRLKETFPYEETEDQVKAIEDIVNDLCKQDFPADRIIVGDSGVGKTEIAVRAAAIVAYAGKQVAFVAPTTPLALQHYIRIKERLVEFPFRVEMLSRLVPPHKEKRIIEDIKEGRIDIVIGTHKVLNILHKFHNLGLLIVDEEQRFGVAEKEKIARIKATVHTISLTATPIPRTLKMALSGLKDISVIKKKPPGRGTIITSLIKQENIKEVIEHELMRDGQIIYIYPHIEGLGDILSKLSFLFPNATISLIHGKMTPRDIERVILSFMLGETKILVATKIVALGIDIPYVNTMVIERADLFGLSELYQLRGRVGRGNRDAYCYLIVPQKLSDNARKRLEVFLDISNIDLDSIGLKLSLKDLEMRGAGNILGKEQSGHILEVGFDVYLEILQEVIDELKEKVEIERKSLTFEPKVEIDVPAFIPAEIIQDPIMRISFYRTFAVADNEKEVDKIIGIIFEKFAKDKGENEEELLKIYPELENFIKIIKLKILMRKLNIFSASFSKDMLYVELNSQFGRMKISLNRGIDELTELLKSELNKKIPTKSELRIQK